MALALLVALALALEACGGGAGQPAPQTAASAPPAASPAGTEAASPSAKPGTGSRPSAEGESRETTLRGPQGGELRSADDRLSLVVPGGLSPRSVRFKVTSIAARDLASPGGHVVVGGGYELTAEEEGQGPLKRFARPVQLRFTVRPADLPAGVQMSQLKVANHDGKDWVPVPSTLDAAGATVSADVDHFSKYAVTASKSAASPSASAPSSPAATAQRSGTPSVSVATPTVVSSADASKALTSWAQSTLSLSLSPNPASGFTTSASGTIPPSLLEQLNLSTSLGTVASVAVAMAGSAYGGVPSNGAMLLTLGSGSLTGDINVDVQTASMGYTGLKVADAYPADANGALSLIKKTYPGVANRSYAPVTSQTGSYVYKAAGQRTVTTRSGPKVVAEVVLAGVSRVNNQTFVYVAVGTGEFAKTLQ